MNNSISILFFLVLTKNRKEIPYIEVNVNYLDIYARVLLKIEIYLIYLMRERGIYRSLINQTEKIYGNPIAYPVACNYHLTIN